jgi:hypothetical protein
MITEDYVSFETAKLLRKKGFDELCRSYWSDNNSLSFEHTKWFVANDNDFVYLLRPTLQMAMKWLREKHGIFTIVQPNFQPDCIKFDAYILPYHPDKAPNAAISMGMCEDTYGAVCDTAIKYCLENLI